MFEAPAPISVIETSGSFLPTTLRALMTPARLIVAVPCWSSCQTAISHSFRSRSRMPKHFGCSMSSRFTPPKDGVISFTVSMIFSGSFVARGMGKASTPPRYLNNRAFPSMTGNPASGPMSPRPRTRVPSVTIATWFHLFVRVQTLSGSALISKQGWATPGVYQIAKSLKLRTGTRGTISIFPW